MPASKKPAKKTSVPKRKVLIWVVVAACATSLAIIVLLTILQRVVPNSHLVVKDETAVQREVQQLLGSINLEGTVVYEEAKDKGCVDQGGFLQIDYVCSVSARRYFKMQGSSGVALRKADAVLKDAGYERSPFSQQNDTAYEAIFSGDPEAHTLLRYRNTKSPEMYVTVGYFVSASNNSDFQLTDLVAKGKISVAPGEFIYDIGSDVPYWSCSNKSPLTEQPCPQPPSALK